MTTTTLDVPPIHCALCRSQLVAAVEALGARALTATIGSGELVVDSDDDDVLRGVVAAVAAVVHPTTPA